MCSSFSLKRTMGNKLSCTFCKTCLVSSCIAKREKKKKTDWCVTETRLLPQIQRAQGWSGMLGVWDGDSWAASVGLSDARRASTSPQQPTATVERLGRRQSSGLDGDAADAEGWGVSNEELLSALDSVRTELTSERRSDEWEEKNLGMDWIIVLTV